MTKKQDPFPNSITDKCLSVLYICNSPRDRLFRVTGVSYGDEVLGGVSPRSKFRIHSLEQTAGTNLQTLLRHSSLQSKYSLSLHITFFL